MTEIERDALFERICVFVFYVCVVFVVFSQRRWLVCVHQIRCRSCVLLVAPRREFTMCARARGPLQFADSLLWSVVAGVVKVFWRVLFFGLVLEVVVVV